MTNGPADRNRHARNARNTRRAGGRRAPPFSADDPYHAWPDASGTGASLVWFMLLAGASGAAAFVYRVVWIRQLSLMAGAEAQALIPGIGALLAGFALGSAWFGRIADRLVRPLRLVVLLEAGTLALSVAVTWMLPRAAATFGAWHAYAGPLAWVLPGMLVGVPSVLAGGTLPALMGAVNPADTAIGRVGAWLRAANLGGAAAGTLAVNVMLIPSVGVDGSVWSAAALNLAAALLALLLSMRASGSLAPRFDAPVITLTGQTRDPAHERLSEPSGPDRTIALEGPRESFTEAQAAEDAEAEAAQTRDARYDAPLAPPPAPPYGPTIDALSATAPTRPPHAGLALALYAIAGGVALGFAAAWSQLIAQFISPRGFAFAIVLAVGLLGSACGSAAASRFADRWRDAWGAFAALIASAGLVALLEIALLDNGLAQWQGAARDAALGADGDVLAAMGAGFAMAAFGIVFLPTLLLGAAFPFALRLTATRAQTGRNTGRYIGRNTGRDSGTAIALNTAGGVTGLFLAGFVLVPVLGVVRALGALALVAALCGLLAAWRATGVRRETRQIVTGLAALTLAAALFIAPAKPASLLAASRGGSPVFYEESAGGTVAALEQHAGPRTVRRLYVQGVFNSGDGMPSLRHQRLLALLPLVIHRDAPRSALVIGLGSGIAGGALLTFAGLQQRVVAEPLPAVVRAAPHFQGNHDVARDPRIEIRLRDGRSELLGSPQRYDVIALDPPPPFTSGAVNLYTTGFYRLAAARLASGGIVAQWLPLSTQSEDDTRSLVQSFITVFPHVTLWTTELHEMLLVGSPEPLELDVPRITARFAQPQMAAALRAVGVASPAALLGTYVTDRAGLVRYAADMPPVTDDRPRIEYAPWVRGDALPSTLGHLLALRADPPLLGSDESFHAAMRASYGALQSFYAAGLDAYRGDREAWSQDVRSAIDAEPDNVYFRWVLGDAK